MSEKPYNLRAAAVMLGITPLDLWEHIQNGEQHCSACKEWLPTACFYKDKGRPSGLSARCRDCNSAQSKARRVTLARYEIGRCSWCNKGRSRVVPFRGRRKVCVNRCFYEASREVERIAVK
jgi:hypothetical protein